MLPDDRLVCAFVRPRAVGDTFRTWPLHVTIVPWFRLPVVTDRLVDGLAEAMKPISAFTSTAVAETMLGPRHNRPALLLAEPTPFRDIEERVRTYFHKKRAWLVDETTKKPRSFRPHVTLQKDDRLVSGHQFMTDRLYIVEQKGDYKQVVGEVRLELYE